MTESKDQVLPSGRWEFDAEVTSVFDNMLERSIPEYNEMRRLCFALASRYAKHNTAIVDLGSSRGGAIAQLVDKFGAHNRYIGVEISEPMREAALERFGSLVDAGIVSILPLDLREAYPPYPASVTLSVLTLQFTPIEYRLRILKKVYDHTLPGGAFILVEKVLGSSAGLDEDFVDVYYGMKREHGYTQEQIDRKRLSLEGVLVPVTAHWNEELLRSAGFSEIDCFWRWSNFAAWIAVKSER